MHTAAEIRTRIEDALEGATATVSDLTGGGDHFRADVVWAGFAGQSLIDQHRAVYASVQDLLDAGSLHALSIGTKAAQ